jgi:hypothetical protein
MSKLTAVAGIFERKGQPEIGWGVVGPSPFDWTRWREIREFKALRCLRTMLKDETQSHKGTLANKGMVSTLSLDPPTT